MATLVVALLFLPLLAQPSALAQEVVAGRPSATTSAHREQSDTVAINLAPAICGVFAMQWEHRFYNHFSLALLGGAGIGSSLSTFTDMALLEVGAQVRAYAMATERQSLGVAVEVMAGWLPGDGQQARRGQALSPRLVYKLVSRDGLTAELQLGAAFTQRSAVQVGTGTRVSVQSGPVPIQALALGYSF